MITEEEALVHPRRNEVLRSLGVEPDVVVDLHQVDLQPGDQILLCSDGLSGVVRDAEIAEVMHRESPAEAVRTLVDFANSRGGPDNVTVQIARIPGPEPEPAPAAGGEHQQVRALTLALIAVASVLAAILVWTLVGELRGTPAGPALAPPSEASGDLPAPKAEEPPAREPSPIVK
jgi:hypothetical protein